MSIQRIISSSSLLTYSEKSGQSTSDLKVLLLSRLSQYRAQAGIPNQEDDEMSLEDVKITTAREALAAVRRVQDILDDEEHTKLAETPSSSQPKTGNNMAEEVPSIGTRDIVQIRTLLTIVFKWGTELLLARVQAAWPLSSKEARTSSSDIVALDSIPESHNVLKEISLCTYALLFPRGVHGSMPQTLISKMLLNRHTTDLLRPALALGWAPQNVSELTPVVNDLRHLAMRLISALPPSQTIASLGSVLSANPSPALHVQKACKSIMSRQLLRPDGVRGLCAVVFGEDDVASESAPLEKLEHFSRILNTVPASISEQEYFQAIIPPLLALLRHDAHPAHRRAAAFSISRMLLMPSPAAHVGLPLLHNPLLKPASPDIEYTGLNPEDTISTIQVFLANTDPAPTLMSSILSPVVPPLYAILAALDRLKVADPSTKEAVRGLLHTWGRIVASHEGVAVLWACVSDQGGTWTADISGAVKRTQGAETEPALALFTPQDLKRAEENGDLDANANFLGLRPDPAHFIQFIRSLDRTDIASDLFVRLLEAYRVSKTARNSDPLKTLLYLQLVLQIQEQLAEGPSSTNILKNPSHILSFIKHALDSATTEPSKIGKSDEAKVKRGLNLQDLRIVDDIVDEDEDFDADADSDDEDDGSEAGIAGADDEILTTAVNLLLAVLEANSELSVRTTPLLSDILEQIEQLMKHQSEAIRALARESRMVLTARLASTSMHSSSQTARDAASSNAVQTYQKALKLLQDPILPVRAHGLLLLRELVTPTGVSSAWSSDLQPLAPAILDIFLQSVQDDDSYIFLNAVQGLSALVANFGKEVLKALMTSYTKGVDGMAEPLSQSEVDTRLRIGEALGQVIRQSGDILPDYANLLIPPLFALVRASHLPTTLRTSALSLLGQCVDTSDLAILPYAADLADAMIQLLQLESVRPGPERRARAESESTMDNSPTAANPKFPPFRRASLHFIALLVRAYTSRVYKSSNVSELAKTFPVQHANTTLGYIAATDEDDVVRAMAREVLEALHDLNEASLGF